MAGWKLGPVLAAGNAVVLKPSEMTPFSSLRAAELAVRAGIPAGIVNVVLGDGPTTGTALTGHPGIAKVSFTGSTGAGQAVMANIARTGVKPMTLELGGKSPQVVFADADLALAADCIARSMLFNAGQACVAGSRVIVAASVADALSDALITRMATARAGPTWDAASEYSPIISERQIARIAGLVDAAVTRGRRGAGRRRTDGRPRLLLRPDASRRREPRLGRGARGDLGPVLTLQTFETEEEALALADHPTYGLCAGVYTRDLSRALRAMKRIEAGTVWVNRYGRSRDASCRRAATGPRASGLGREAYHANRRSKSVLIDIGREAA